MRAKNGAAPINRKYPHGPLLRIYFVFPETVHSNSLRREISIRQQVRMIASRLENVSNGSTVSVKKPERAGGPRTPRLTGDANKAETGRESALP